MERRARVNLLGHVWRGRFRSFLVPFLGFAILLCAAPTTTVAQSGASRQLTLIHPDDQGFDALLNDNFPGFEKLDGYAALRPFLVLLRNDTSHAASAYSLEWDLQTSSGNLNREFVSYIQRDHLLAARFPFGPGELLLLSPNLAVNPTEYSLWNPGDQAKILSMRASHPPYSSPNIYAASITVVVDAVIYDDGGYAGADHFQLLTKYQAARDAERDEGASVVQLLDSNASIDDVVAALNADAQSGRAARIGLTTAPAVLYAYEYALRRGEEAQWLLHVHKRGGGIETLKNRATSMANYPREMISPLQSQ